MSSDVTIVTDAGASVTFCSCLEAPYTTSIARSWSIVRPVKSGEAGRLVAPPAGAAAAMPPVTTRTTRTPHAFLVPDPQHHRIRLIVPPPSFRAPREFLH